MGQLIDLTVSDDGTRPACVRLSGRGIESKAEFWM